jgi:hypothetical protein
MLALVVFKQDQQGFSNRISLLKCFKVAVNKECPVHDLSVLYLPGYPLHTPAMLSMPSVLAASN